MYEVDEVRKIIGQQSITEDELDIYFDDLYEYYLNSGDMPYGTAKARTGDPHQWVFDRLEEIGIIRCGP